MKYGTNFSQWNWNIARKLVSHRDDPTQRAHLYCPLSRINSGDGEKFFGSVLVADIILMGIFIRSECADRNFPLFGCRERERERNPIKWNTSPTRSACVGLNSIAVLANLTRLHLHPIVYRYITCTMCTCGLKTSPSFSITFIVSWLSLTPSFFYGYRCWLRQVSLSHFFCCLFAERRAYTCARKQLSDRSKESILSGLFACGSRTTSATFVAFFFSFVPLFAPSDG